MPPLTTPAAHYFQSMKACVFHKTLPLEELSQRTLKDLSGKLKWVCPPGTHLESLQGLQDPSMGGGALHAHRPALALLSSLLVMWVQEKHHLESF